MKTLLLMLVCAVLSVKAFAQDAASGGIAVHNGMGNGNDYLEMRESARQDYAIGFVNGILLAPLFGAPKSSMAWFESCVEGMSNNQVAEIIYQYVKSHPAEWHHGLHIVSYQAFLAACPDSPGRKRRDSEK